ncbi:hypothetical protein N7520_003367 [Penicillium odoratum]|uniref:uncharacterized protein n=1 Tax=Penicillium odoratum TaxID=1167516 RepID=UPI0025488626|nr:uncharacterized protein N7520_003367 [Penicillium odoratum]KAJ5768808.1 hypothetical protein N7520_003367 [Penicillium odoratum]
MNPDKRKFVPDEEDQLAPKKRVIGPALPPSTQSPESKASSDESETESDDDFGPSMPPPNGVSVVNGEPTLLDSSSVASSHEKKASQRDQWMLRPPEQSDWASKIDPTQLRSRKFQTGKSARAPGSKQVDASWVETPEERIRRLGDEMMGVGGPSRSSSNPSSKSDARRTQSMEERIKKFNDQTRKAALPEKPDHEKKEVEDDPSARAFDREKDMGISSKISSAQRREMVNRASDYGSRFSKGSFL